jgi:hypothetical protein
MKLFVTGDTHGGQEDDFSKLTSSLFPEGKELTKEDFVIVCGDFGLTFPNYNSKMDKQQEYWIKWLQEKPWTILFIDGNHENHEFLKTLPVVEKFGGKVSVLREFYHLRRGEIYTFDNLKVFCMGGAMSTDKETRIEGVDWWRDEVPSYSEMDYAINNLEKYDYKVDLILAHTLPMGMIKRWLTVKDIPLEELDGKMLPLHRLDEVASSMVQRYNDPTASFLQEVVNRTTFDHYYCGHFHDDITMGKFTILYQQVKQIL